MASHRIGPNWTIQVRETTHRREPGWLVCGTSPRGKSIKIFTPDEPVAQHIARKVRAGQEIGLVDFEGQS